MSYDGSGIQMKGAICMEYMKYKKTTAILLSAALILSCLAGCGRRNTPAAHRQTPAAKPKTAPETGKSRRTSLPRGAPLKTARSFRMPG